MVDNVMKVVALAAFIGFIAILGVRVPSPSLIAVLIVVAAMATYDLLIRPYLSRNRDRS